VLPNPDANDMTTIGDGMSLEAIADGARLAALRDTGVMDTEPEQELDRFTALIAELLGVPVSTITLVDRDRQFWKSAHGLTGAWADARETPLSHSLCKHLVATGEPLVVSDTRSDPRVADSLAVRDMSITAYAGMPLVLADGHAVGALAAIDFEPHPWSVRRSRSLAALAEIVSSILDLRRELNQRSLHDPVTGLPNRSLTIAYGEQLSSVGDGGGLLAVAVGIDYLSHISETYGTAQGDRLVSLVARRIAHQLSSDDILGRLTNDIFVVLRPRVADRTEALELAHGIRDAACAEPVTISGEEIEVLTSVGVATAAPGIDGDALIGRALACVEDARHGDRGTIVYGPSVVEETATRRQLRAALSGAVRRGEISVNFQPIVELATGRTIGYEALARWRHPELGLVGPSEFIPIAESTGDIVLIGEHVLRTACTQLSIWRALVPRDRLGVTVNFSPMQLAVPNIAEVVTGILTEAGLPGSALTLEITEGVFISSGAPQRRNLEAIRALEVQIALDDFGTGYSALSYLKRFPVDMIKVDRCFLDGLETDHRDAALMRAILAIGMGMDLDVIAEGVETRAQREMLRLSGCHWGQGFLFAEPLPAEQIHITGSRSVVVAPPVPGEKIVAAPA
jgi:diguanylate cyclase (GGDEF)-like protein